MNIRPAFEVKPLPDQWVMRKVAVYDREAKEQGKPPIHYVDRKEPAGYLVFFPNGHSMRVPTLEELKRLGFSGSPHKVDLDTGEVVPDNERSLEQLAAMKAGGAAIIDLVEAPTKKEMAND